MPNKSIGAKGQTKVSKVMREFKAGKLKNSGGKVVTDRRQATAIALSEARKVSGAKR